MIMTLWVLSFRSLAFTFSLKDMENFKYFLGDKVTSIKDDVFLSQHKYIWGLLLRTHMTLQRMSAPTTSISLHFTDGITSADKMEDWRIIGTLQYLSLTHSYIFLFLFYFFCSKKNCQNLYWKPTKFTGQ